MMSFDLSFLALSMSPLELAVRGTLMYWFLFLIFRFILRRDSASAGITDILFVVLLGDAAQNAMIGQGHTVGNGMVLILSLVFWNYLLDFLGYHVPLVSRLTDAPPVVLVRDGRMLHRNMRKEHLTPDEIQAKLRGAGLEDIGKVKVMHLESNGSFTVVKEKA
ncbi:MAG TPA: YetF domain-containing protein [Rhodanobacteraceae bacterium]|nr:YetF domain-containing protein [Rhodanobacteraceae bacterium]